MLTATPGNEKGSDCSAAFRSETDHWSLESLLIFFWRNFISRSRALTTNWPVLSPCSFNASTASATSCGTRTSKRFDFALMPLVAMMYPLSVRCPTSYLKQAAKKSIDVSDTNALNCVRHLANAASEITKPGSATNTNRASNHNVIETYIMACSHDIQTRPEFTYLFLGTPSDRPTSSPVVLRAEANAEELARAHFPGWDLVFAAQIRTKAPCRLQLFDAEDRFSWIFEQRFDACASGVQEVAHV